MVANQHIRKTSDTGECNKVKEVPSSLIDGEKAAILESIPDPVILVDTDLKVVWSNAALNKLFNLNADQIKGRHCFETMYGLKRPCEACPVIRAINTGQPCTVDDFSSLGKRWMLRAYPLRDEEGNVTRIAEIFTDITESKRAEDTLNKVSKLQSMILDNSTVGIAFVRNRIYEWVNPKLCELYGIPKEQLEGASTRIIFPDDEAYQRQGDEIYSSLAQGKKAIIETCRRKGDGSLFWCRLEGIALDASRPQEGSIWIVEDITKRKLAEEALEKRILTLTKPLDGIEKNITFEDLFNLSDLQRLQDMLADSWGVAALLTRPDGTAITRPSNFTYFCKFIRNNEKGFRNCQKSDAELGQYNPPGPIIHKCLSAGLWGAGASITIGRRHIANWLIGQVRNEAQSEEEIMEYARSIGIDEIAFREAFLQVPVMPQEKFEQIAHALFALANQLSAIAYQNIQQARFIADRKQAEEALRKSEEKFRGIYEESPLGIELYDREGILLDVNRACLDIFGLSDVKAVKKGFKLFENPNLSEECKAQLRRGESVRLEMPYDFEKIRSLKLYQTKKRGIIYLFVLITPLRGVTKETDIGYLVHTRDITKRKQAEQALLESEKKYRRLHESMTEAFAIVDMNGRIQESNRAYQSMLGYSEEELRHLTYSDITPEKWHALEKSIIEEQILVEGRAEVYEKEYQRKDGSVFPVELSTFLIRDDSGNPVGMWAIVRDITERKKMETELNAARDYLRTVFNNVYDAIFVHDLDGKVIDVNDKMLEMYKVSREEAVNYNIISDYSATDEFMEMSRANCNMAMSGVNVFFEWKARRPKDGSVFDVEVFLTKLVLPDGDYILANVRDISGRKCAEAVLKESEEKYNKFFKTSRDCVFMTSNDGRIIDINDAAVELLGYSSREELFRVKVPDLYAELEEWIKHTRIISECGYGKEYPVDFRRKDGSIRHTLVTSAARYDANGDLIGFQGTVRDVTEQRRNEEELRKYRKKLEIMVAERTRELEDKTKNLQEVNTALNVLLKKRDQDKKNLEENFVANIGSMVLPYLEKMKKNNLDAQQQFCLDTVEKNLAEIASPLLKNIQQFNLTPREVQIAYLIKDGKTTKEIASVLGIAEGSISTHRKNLRKKLGLDRDSNLQSHLRYFEK